jgi:hypothetical protein
MKIDWGGSQAQIMVYASTIKLMDAKLHTASKNLYAGKLQKNFTAMKLADI